MDAPTPIRDPSKDVIHGNALRLTWISGAVGGIGALVTVFDKNITAIFGSDVSDGIRASVLIAIIAAWALIAVADLLARAIATAAKARSPEIATLPAGLKVKLTEGLDEKGWLVVAIKVDKPGDDPQFLVVKKGESAKWVAQANLVATSG